MNFLERFEDYLMDNDKSDSTINSYITDIKQFLDYMKQSIENIDRKSMKNYTKLMNEKGLNINTINRKLISIKAFIDFLNTYYDKGIPVKIKLEKQQYQDYLEEMLDASDFQRIIKAAEKLEDKRAIAIFYTLYYTGMRVSEMLQLKSSDVGKDIITIKGKGSKYREVFIPQKLNCILKDYLEYRKKFKKESIEALFIGERGAINRQTIHNIIKYYAGQAKVKLSKAHAHNFRHLYCIMLVEKGLGIDEVADLAGHSNINTTRIYTRKTKKELLKAINKL